MPDSKQSNDSEGFVASDARPIMLTEQAIEASTSAMKECEHEGEALRVSVVGGGCMGYQYNMDFEKEKRIEDLAIEYESLCVYIDPFSAAMLKGTVIDFVSGPDGTGFKFNNPNMRRTCACSHAQ